MAYNLTFCLFTWVLPLFCLSHFWMVDVMHYSLMPRKYPWKSWQISSAMVYNYWFIRVSVWIIVTGFFCVHFRLYFHLLICSTLYLFYFYFSASFYIVFVFYFLNTQRSVFILFVSQKTSFVSVLVSFTKTKTYHY